MHTVCITCLPVLVGMFKLFLKAAQNRSMLYLGFSIGMTLQLMTRQIVLIDEKIVLRDVARNIDKIASFVSCLVDEPS